MSQGFGYTAETHRMVDSKYDPEHAREAVEWVNAVLGRQAITGVEKDEVNAALKSGIVLCELINTLQPNSVPKVHPESANKFKLMENIGNFLTAAEKYGVHRGDLFQSVYLEKNQNTQAVIGGIFALGRKAQKNGFSGPTLGPKESEVNKREFSEEQLLHGRVHGI